MSRPSVGQLSIARVYSMHVLRDPGFFHLLSVMHPAGKQEKRVWVWEIRLLQAMFILSFFLKDFIYLFILERGKVGERKGKKNVLLHIIPH